MISSRYRDYDFRQPITGTHFWEGRTEETTIRTLNHGEYATCEDVTGNWQGTNPLKISKVTTSGFILDGEKRWPPWEPSHVIRGYYGCPAAYAPPPPSHPPSMSALSLLQSQNKAWEILARTNPSSPHISVPTFIGELKDFPELVRSYGRGLLKRVASGHLAWSFAVKPMISDVMKLCEFAEAVDRRIKLLTDLRDRKYLGRRTNFGEVTVDDPVTTVAIESALGTIVQAQRYTSHTMRHWGATRWHTAIFGGALPRTSQGMRKLAERITYGFVNYEAIRTLWELLPWSWFYDYFFGIGTVIKALNNTVGVRSSNTCYMRTITSTRRYSRITSESASWIRSSGLMFEERVSKLRDVVTPIIPFVVTSVSLLEPRQWLILASLAASKALK